MRRRPMIALGRLLEEAEGRVVPYRSCGASWRPGRMFRWEDEWWRSGLPAVRHSAERSLTVVCRAWTSSR